ncbi:MAG: hypothetical protein ABMA02_04020 [Saprospiraceae bacterium]
MTTLSIKCHYEIPLALQEVVGVELSAIRVVNGSVFLGDPICLRCVSNVILSFKNEKSGMGSPPNFQFISKGHESYAGNLYGIDITKFGKPKYDLRNPATNPLYHFDLNVSSKYFSKIVKIVGIGEVRKEDVSTAGQEEEIECFFPEGAVLPDIISIDKRTLEVVGFLFDTGKWLYIFPQDEGHFYMELDSDTTPEELINNWETIDDVPKPLQILQVFE